MRAPSALLDRRRFATFLLAATAALVVAGCGGSSGSAKDASQKHRPSKQGSGAADTSPGSEDGATKTTPAPAPSPGPAPDADGSLPLTITTPPPFTSVVRRTGVVLTGTAKLARPTLAWAILGSDLRPLAQGTMRASCTAPCVGHYRVRLATARVPVGSWELHVWQPDAAGGDERLHDTLVPITVVEQATPGAPPADAFPPGGAPQG